jgi:hypothetical protein
MATADSAHAAATRLEVHDLARRLMGVLGATCVAVLSGSRDRKIAYRWVKPDGPKPHTEAEVRMRCAWQAWVLVSAAEGDDVARAWFIGCNPRLAEPGSDQDGEQPVIALRNGRYADVLATARAFADGVDG